MKVLKLHLVSIDWCYCPRYFDRQMSMLVSVKKVSLLFSMPYNNAKNYLSLSLLYFLISSMLQKGQVETMKKSLVSERE